jgi:HTH-type transcriptional regulator/antitoxin HigA
MSKYKAFIDVGPGDSIKEELEYYGWEQKDLAEIMDRTEKNISQLLTNKAPITFETALQLSKVFKQSPQFWLNLDANYRQRMQENATVKATAAKALIYRYMPVRELRKFLDLPKKVDNLVAAVCKFWNIDSLDFGFLEKQIIANFRKSEARNNFNPYYALTWLQLIRKHTAEIKPQSDYSKKCLTDLARNIPAYTVENNGITHFIEALEACGVIFVQLDHMPQTYTDGASLWHRKTPVIAYTARYDRNDNFWFTVAHEIGHLLLHRHDSKSFFIDSLDHLDYTDKKEEEANDFAENVLKTKQILASFKTVLRPSSIRIQILAKELKLHPAIICGCLQHHEKASWTSFHELKTDALSQIPSHVIISKVNQNAA